LGATNKNRKRKLHRENVKERAKRGKPMGK
jgi:hypothetical protein